ncbi:MAG: aromatic ring-hydroxylating oxygenase subunit alpha, partial [Halioglobus sp.]
MNINTDLDQDALSEPVTYPVDAYISAEYARAERDKLWRKVWLQAGRIEELPEVGNYLTFDIMDDTILIVRTAAHTIKAYHNVCPHRGRRLIDTPKGARNARGRRAQFVCAYHGWRFNLDGENTHILHKEDWGSALDGPCSGLQAVTSDSWGGWVWVNLNPGC